MGIEQGETCAESGKGGEEMGRRHSGAREGQVEGRFGVKGQGAGVPGIMPVTNRTSRSASSSVWLLLSPPAEATSRVLGDLLGL